MLRPAGQKEQDDVGDVLGRRDAPEGNAEAERFGLVNRVVPVEAYLDAALELARTVAAKAPLAVQLTKEAILRGQDVPLEAGLAHERHNFYLLFGTADKQEGIRAFLEKRRAEWQGR